MTKPYLNVFSRFKKNEENLYYMRNTARKYAVLNAIKFKGKANHGAVVGGVLSEHPDAKKDMAKLQNLIKEVIEEVNSLSFEVLLEESKNYEAHKREDRGMFSFFDIKKGDKVITAFPPEPSKYFHIGHAKALFSNYMLAKEHKGKFILRFDDTNPDLAKKEFYDKQIADIEWLGIKPDKIIYASDFLKDIDNHANELIKQKKAYVCNCPSETMSELRKKKKSCEHTNNFDEKAFNNLVEGKVLRLKLDMTSNNSTFRDPVIYRVINKPHLRVKGRSKWPAYDFETAVLDGMGKITHRIRGKEFELRAPLQRKIQELLKLPITQTYEFARFEIKGAPTSGRIIREGIKNKKYSGWDDPQLVNLVSLKRRGFLPEAIKNFVISTGFSKAESTLTWEDFIKHNRRLLDQEAKRYFFIKKPKKITIKNAPKQKLELNLNPNKKKGGRKFETNNVFFIEETDYKKLKNNSLYRLMDCLNFKKTGKGFEFVKGDINDYKKAGKGIMHWLPENNLKIEVLTPEKELIKGIAETNINTLKTGEIIQFERFGFCRLGSKNKFLFTHK